MLKEEGCYKAVKILLLEIAGDSVNLEDQMFKKITNLIALDRGYQSEELLNQLLNWGWDVIGTLKRCKFAPFVLVKMPDSMLISSGWINQVHVLICLLHKTC